jgi:hypothetical protein
MGDRPGVHLPKTVTRNEISAGKLADNSEDKTVYAMKQ